LRQIVCVSVLSTKYRLKQTVYVTVSISNLSTELIETMLCCWRHIHCCSERVSSDSPPNGSHASTCSRAQEKVTSGWLFVSMAQLYRLIDFIDSR